MPRAMWSGSISFGLVNVPVRMYTAVRDTGLHFHRLSADGTCRLRNKLVCPETGQEFDYKDTARGYEVAPGQYVILRDEELEKLKPQAGRAIDIRDFVDLKQIDPIYYDHAYYLAPDEGGAKGYQLLLRVMKRQQKVGIAKFVMRDKQYLAAIRPLDDVLVLETMHFADEVMGTKELELPQAVEVGKKELDVAARLVDALAADFEPAKYQDEYRQRVQEVIDKKARGQEVVVHAAAEEEAPRIINLMEALRRSLEQAKAAGGGSAAETKPKRRKKSA